MKPVYGAASEYGYSQETDYTSVCMTLIFLGLVKDYSRNTKAGPSKLPR
jgi:hypothetical protein